MSTKIFPTAQDAETAFYEALERGDYETMVAVWAEDEEVLCVHPGGPRLRGTDEVLAQWKRILEGGQRLQVRITHQVVIAGMMVTVHSVQENRITSYNVCYTKLLRAALGYRDPGTAAARLVALRASRNNFV